MDAVERGGVLSRSEYLNGEELPLILYDWALGREPIKKDAIPADLLLEEKVNDDRLY